MKFKPLFVLLSFLCVHVTLADSSSTNTGGFAWTGLPDASPSPDASTNTSSSADTNSTTPEDDTIVVNPSPMVISRLPIGNPIQFYVTQNCITVTQYCAFLNAVAKHQDPYHLYDNKLRDDSRIACINCTATTHGLEYTVLDTSKKLPNSTVVVATGDLPITYVSLLDAARFCNWMENGQPIGPEGPETTETGSYDLVTTEKNAAADTIKIRPALQTITLKPGSKWSLLSEDPKITPNPQDQWTLFQGYYSSIDALQNRVVWEWTSSLYNYRLNSKFYVQVKPDNAPRQFLAETKLIDTGFRLVFLP